MPSIGIFELLIIILVVVLFVKPEDLPRFFRTMGNLYGQAQRYFYQMKMYSRQTFDEISRLDQPPPEPDPWHDDVDPDHDYCDSEHDPYHHDHYHDEHGHYHDDHHDFDHEHHEYESAYAVEDLPEAAEAVAAATGKEPATKAAPAGEGGEAPEPQIIPEEPEGTVRRGSSTDAPPKAPESKPTS